MKFYDSLEEEYQAAIKDSDEYWKIELSKKIMAEENRIHRRMFRSLHTMKEWVTQLSWTIRFFFGDLNRLRASVWYEISTDWPYYLILLIIIAFIAAFILTVLMVYVPGFDYWLWPPNTEEWVAPKHRT